MERYDNMFDDLRSLIMGIILGNNSDLEDFNSMIEIDKDLVGLKIQMENQTRAYKEARNRYIILEKEIESLKEKLKEYEKES